MKNWLKSLLALLAADRAPNPLRTDWRGRPLGESAGGAISTLTVAEGDLFATVCPPSASGGCRAVPPQRDLSVDHNRSRTVE
jgi:hypothetical protein